MEEGFVMITDEALSLPTLAAQQDPQQLDRFKQFLQKTTTKVDRLNIEDWERGMISINTPTDEFVRTKLFLGKVKEQIKDYEEKKNN